MNSDPVYQGFIRSNRSTFGYFVSLVKAARTRLRDWNILEILLTGRFGFMFDPSCSTGRRERRSILLITAAALLKIQTASAAICALAPGTELGPAPSGGIPVIFDQS